jgi:hypothetical protein
MFARFSSLLSGLSLRRCGRNSALPSARLRVELLEARDVPAVIADFAVGTGQGGIPLVQVYGSAGDRMASFFAVNGSEFQALSQIGYRIGSVSVTVGDVTGDGVSDVIAALNTVPGSAFGSFVRAFDGALIDPASTFQDGALVATFLAFNNVYRGPVSLATQDTGGLSETLVISTVQQFDAVAGFQIAGGTATMSYLIFPTFLQNATPGVTVASGDINGDAVEDLLVSEAPGSGTDIIVADGAAAVAGSLNSFAYIVNTSSFGLPPTSVTATASDLDETGTDEIIIGFTTQGGSQIRVLPAGTATGLVVATEDNLAFNLGSYQGGFSLAAYTQPGNDGVVIGFPNIAVGFLCSGVPLTSTGSFNITGLVFNGPVLGLMYGGDGF